MNVSDPFAAPLIDPDYLSSEFDVLAMMEGVRLAAKFLESSVWDRYIVERYSAFADVDLDDDQQLEDYVRSASATSDHPVGGATMSAVDAEYGVVDPDLLVKGVEGLRIVDASVFVSSFLLVRLPISTSLS